MWVQQFPLTQSSALSLLSVFGGKRRNSRPSPIGEGRMLFPLKCIFRNALQRLLIFLSVCPVTIL